MYIKNYFLIGPRIIFRCIANLFLGLKCFAGLAVKADWFESLTSLGDHFENFANEGVLSKRMPRRNIVRERNKRGLHLSYKICQELVVCALFFLNFKVGDTLILCVFVPKLSMCSTRRRLEVQDWVENSSIGQTCHVQ